MINSQYNLTLQDIGTFKKLKDSSTYRTYIQGIIKSPVYKQIAQEHINNIDVSADITKLKEKMELSPQALSKIYKSAISKMAVSIIADTVILKELSELRMENAKASMKDIKTDMDEGFLESFLIGMAPSEFYVKAEQKLKKKPDANSVLYKGLIEFKKLHSTEGSNLSEIEGTPTKVSTKEPEPTNDDEEIDISAESIDLG